MHRASMICSKSKLDAEIKFIFMTICNNGFPLNVVPIVVKNKMIDFNNIKLSSVRRYPVYWRLHWLGGISN